MRVRADEHVVADPNGMRGPAAHERILHDRAAFADRHLPVLGGHDRAEQDGRAGADPDVAAQHGRRCHVGARVDGWTRTSMFDEHFVALPGTGSTKMVTELTIGLRYCAGEAPISPSGANRIRVTRCWYRRTRLRVRRQSGGWFGWQARVGSRCPRRSPRVRNGCTRWSRTLLAWASGARRRGG